MLGGGGGAEKNKRVSHLLEFEVEGEEIRSCGNPPEIDEEEECNLPGTTTPAEFLLRSIDTHYRKFEKNASDKNKRLFNASILST